MEFLLFWLVFCGIAAAIAGNKGRSAIGFFFLSVLISPLLGILIALVVQPNKAEVESKQLHAGDSKKCPFCAEIIKAEATVCRFCGRDMPMRTTNVSKLSLNGPANARTIQNRAKVAFTLPLSAKVGPARPTNIRPPEDLRKDIYLYLNEQQEGPFSRTEI